MQPKPSRVELLEELSDAVTAWETADTDLDFEEAIESIHDAARRLREPVEAVVVVPTVTAEELRDVHEALLDLLNPGATRAREMFRAGGAFRLGFALEGAAS